MTGTPNRAATWLDRVTSPRHAWPCLALAVLFACAPPDGLGVDLCLCHRCTGAPCPGCGLTRGSAALVRGDWRRALNFHPFAPVVLPALAGFGLVVLLPARARGRLREWLSHRARLWRTAYLVAVTLFLSFGAVRWLAVLAGWVSFPTAWF